MNRIITKLNDGTTYNLDSTSEMYKDFLESMVNTNTYIPAIHRVIYNLKTTETQPALGLDGNPVVDEKGRVRRESVPCTPTLATIVYFEDGTKVTVVNSDADTVRLEKKEVTYFKYNNDAPKKFVKVKTGRMVDVAAESSKEIGLIYAIVKRMFGKIDNDPESKGYGSNVLGDGFGRTLRAIIDDAYDTVYDAAYNAEMNKVAREAHKQREAEAKARAAKRRPSLEDNVNTLVEQNKQILEKLDKTNSIG